MTDIVLTGGSGFLGGYVVRAAKARGIRVTEITRDCVFRDGQMHPHGGSPAAMASVLEGLEQAALIHLAGYFMSRHDEAGMSRLITDNVTFSAHVFEAAARAGVGRVVAAGTSWQFDAQGNRAPANLYAVTKQAASDVLAFFARPSGFRAATVVLYDTYGPGDTRAKLVPLLARHWRDRAPLDMTSGHQPINLTHAQDVAAGLLAAARNLEQAAPGSHALWALRAANDISVCDLVGLIQNEVAPELRVNLGAVRDSAAPVALCHTVPSVPGWGPGIDLVTGLRSVFRSEDGA